jgi:disulfide bond formation protein DsbB
MQTKKYFLDWTLMTIWIVSLATLLFSFYQQFFEKNEPCHLCQLQRYVHFSIFMISPIGLIRDINFPIRKVLALMFLFGFSLAIYHSCVQFGWLSDRCTMTQKIENVNDFMTLLEQQHIPCAKVTWKLWGLSAAVFNAILSFFALIVLNSQIIKKAHAHPNDLLKRKTPQPRKN